MEGTLWKSSTEYLLIVGATAVSVVAKNAAALGDPDFLYRTKPSAYCTITSTNNCDINAELGIEAIYITDLLDRAIHKSSIGDGASGGCHNGREAAEQRNGWETHDYLNIEMMLFYQRITFQLEWIIFLYLEDSNTPWSETPALGSFGCIWTWYVEMLIVDPLCFHAGKIC